MLALLNAAGAVVDALLPVGADETPAARDALAERLRGPLENLQHAINVATDALSGPDPEIALLYARDGLAAFVRDLTPRVSPIQ